MFYFEGLVLWLMNFPSTILLSLLLLHFQFHSLCLCCFIWKFMLNLLLRSISVIVVFVMKALLRNPQLFPILFLLKYNFLRELHFSNPSEIASISSQPILLSVHELILKARSFVFCHQSQFLWLCYFPSALLQVTSSRQFQCCYLYIVVAVSLKKEQE